MNISTEFLFKLAKTSLALLWIFTGLTSLFFSPELGFNLLKTINITDISAELLISSGAILDIALGVWLFLSWKIKLCCKIQFFTIITYTILLSIIDASFWLHPFGPLTKNLPILVLILMVFVNEENATNSN